MDPDLSPFRPGQPADIELFVGSSEQIARVTQLVRASAASRFQIAFLTGDRGIGKTSLASFARYLVERDQTAATTHVMLGGVNSLDGFVQRTLEQIIKDNSDRPWYSNILDIFGSRIQSVGRFGVSINLQFTPAEMYEVTNAFPEALRTIQSRLDDNRPSLFVVLDDINALAELPEFANWLKSTVDAIGIHRTPTKVAVLLVGLEETRRSLISLQPSLARVFDVIDIRLWTQDEAEEFFSTYFTRANGSVDPEALQFMATMTGGLPVVAHEIGDAVFRSTSKYPVDSKAATLGVHIAASVVGHKYLQPQIVESLQSEQYREILRILPTDPLTHTFRRSELVSRLPSDSVGAVDAFLRRMRILGAITRDPERGQGAYRFTNPAHYLYFWQQSYSVRNGLGSRN